MIGDGDPLDWQTFDDLLHAAGCSPPRYLRMLDAMEAAGIVDRATHAGNELLRQARNGELAASEARGQLSELLECVRDPLSSQRRLQALAVQIWRFKE